jgi:Domain of unknown function (DUF4082)/PEP-CTERM motif
MNLKANLLLSAAAFALAVPGVGSAATLGLDFLPGNVGVTGSSDFTWTLGYEFTDLTATDVVGLATWNSGVVGTIEIGLWTLSGTLLATADVTSASPTIGSADWLYSAITPVALTPGTTYLVGSIGETDYAYEVNPVSIDPSISYNHNAWAFGGLTYPGNASSAGAEHAFYGGNVVLSSIPEPSTWVMMGIGFAGLGAVAVRRRRRQVAVA